jgi:two-component system chemotaxis response regulator CheY
MPESQLGRKRTVLVVDDDGMIRQMLRTILRQDFDVIGEAASGDNALSMIESLSPEVVCLDILMQKMDGIQTLEAIKANFPKTIVIMVSGSPTIETVQGALGKGAAGFIVKPFSAGKVMDTVKACINKAVGNQ